MEDNTMNVPATEINANDAARILGVDYSTICYWCRNNTINYLDYSNPGSKMKRYALSESEVNHIRDLIKQYGGVRKAMLHYEKDWDDVPQPITTTQMLDVAEIRKCFNQPKAEETEPVKKAFDADKLMNKILRLQDLKEQLENLEAEANQVRGTIELMRKEIMEQI
jgi:hypothetical protein